MSLATSGFDKSPAQSRLILLTAALLEGGTGLALIVLPSFVSWLLLNVHAVEPSLTVARVSGAAMFALAIACWPTEPLPAGVLKPFVAMLAYNLLVSIILIIGGISAVATGLLLWPVVAVHVILSGLLWRVCFQRINRV